MTINNFGKYASILLGIAGLLLMSVHTLIVESDVFSMLFTLDVPYLLSYVLIFPLSLGGILFTYFRFVRDKSSAGNSFFIVVFFKIFGSAIFLIPGLIFDKAEMKEMVYHFMPVFFIFLFVETLLLVRLLNLPLDEK
ncbi:MAG: hypothetical protein IPM77_04545 [Crocinitomicaceae bacterium]|nr:hypothetical protein [Crocinitomicaceae bacterium]